MYEKIIATFRAECSIGWQIKPEHRCFDQRGPRRAATLGKTSVTHKARGEVGGACTLAALRPEEQRRLDAGESGTGHQHIVRHHLGRYRLFSDEERRSEERRVGNESRS